MLKLLIITIINKNIILDTSKSEMLFTVKFSRGFDDVFLVRQNIDIKDLKLQYEEVADAKWASFEEIVERVKTGEFIECNYMDILYHMINCNIKLSKAEIDDAGELLDMQKEIFMPLYKNNLAGSAFVYEKEPGKMKLQIINIKEEHQGKGIAQEVMKRLELMYPQAESWELETALAEKRNCYLYEKMGYVKCSKLQQVNDKLTLLTYKKQKNMQRISCI